jgi:hypothetical protein
VLLLTEGTPFAELLRSVSRDLVLIDFDLEALLGNLSRFVSPAIAKVIDSKTV